MASIDERYYGPLTADDAATAIEQLRSGAEVLPDKALPSAAPPAEPPEPTSPTRHCQKASGRSEASRGG